MVVVRHGGIAEEDSAYPPPFESEKLSWSRNVGKAAGSVRLGFWHERLPPGRRTSFTHAHSDEEEAVWVIEGTCHVRLVHPDGRAEEHLMGPEDFVSFPAGTGIAHCFVNHGDADCRLFVVGERRPEDRARYPDDPAYDAHLAATRPERHWSPG